MSNPSNSSLPLDPDPIIMQFASSVLLSYGSQAASPPSQLPLKPAPYSPSKSGVFLLEEWVEIAEIGDIEGNRVWNDVKKQEETQPSQKSGFRSDPGTIKTFWLRAFYHYMKHNYIRLRSQMSLEDWLFWKSVSGPKANFRRDWDKKKDDFWTKERFGKMFREWFLNEAVEALEKKFGRDSVAGAVYYNHATRYLCEIGKESGTEKDAEM